MASLNALRGLLVAGAVVAGVMAAVGGRWSVSALMLVAVAVHGLGSVWLRQHRPRQHTEPGDATPAEPGPG
jgi:hypothetical protein